MMNDVFISLDLEMTTARPEHQEVIEIAAVKFKGDRVIDTYATLVNPHQHIPYNVQVLTGIKQDDVDRAPSFHEVAGQLIAFVKDHPVVGQTISADIGCLQRKGVHLSSLQIDTFELASILLPHLPAYGLAALAAHLGITVTSQHRASGDALMAGKVFRALLKKALELDLTIVQEINRLAAGLEWAPRTLFLDVEREKTRIAMSGSSIRAQLAAKGGLEEAAFDFMYMGRPERRSLNPRSPRQTIAAEDVSRSFEPGGILSNHFAGYEHRPQQSEMARAVCDALNDGSHLVVEAGTGTGKSFAYLLPAAHFAVANSERVVVSTNTINLQDQLFGKDIPDLLAATGLELKAALVKGRANYLCQLRFAAMRRHLDLSRDEALTLIKVLVWLPMTRTGDVAELNLVEGQRAAWSKLYAPAESCLGSQCHYYRKGTCFVYRARDAAEGSHLVVVNHALLLSDLVVKNKILPDYRFLVVDEAHHFEDEATDQFGYTVTQRDILDHLDGLSQPSAGERRGGLMSEIKGHLRGSGVPAGVEREIDALIRRLHDEMDFARSSVRSLARTLSDFVKRQSPDSRGYESRLRLTRAARLGAGWDEVQEIWEHCSTVLFEIQQGLQSLTAILAQIAEYNVLDYDALLARLMLQVHSSEELRQRVEGIIVRIATDRVCWLNLGQGGDVSLHSAPVHVGEALDQYLFSVKESVILTSATLSTGGSFLYTTDRLGLKEHRQVLVDSPFDYQRSTLLFIPNDVPEPEQPQFQRHVESAVIDLCTASEGRALILFTSYGQLGQTFKQVRPILEDRKILVLAQEPGGRGPSRRQLLQSFKTNTRAVLFGTASFWEGIDVVGEALSLLVIARLPFAVPSDPIVAARGEQYADPFSQYSLPRTILRFKQGFGRLIRSQKDRGVVVVLDRRIQTKSYGPVFLKSLPACTVRSGPISLAPRVVSQWLEAAPGGEN